MICNIEESVQTKTPLLDVKNFSLSFDRAELSTTFVSSIFVIFSKFSRKTDNFCVSNECTIFSALHWRTAENAYIDFNGAKSHLVPVLS